MYLYMMELTKHYCFSVRVYVDAVINHMAGTGREGVGIGGTYYHSTHDGPEFPGVPYDSVGTKKNYFEFNLE